MAKTKRAAKPEGEPARSNPEVVAYLRELDHPLKSALEAVRKIILGADSGIAEGIKWNAPSFHYREYFATAGLRPSEKFVRVVFHKGAEVKDGSTDGMKIADPAGLLEWHASERCSVKFCDARDVRAKARALEAIVKQWIKQM